MTHKASGENEQNKKKKTLVTFLFDAVTVDGAIWVANGKSCQSTGLQSGKMFQPIECTWTCVSHHTAVLIS